MNGIWVSGDNPRLDERMPSCGTPAATRLMSSFRGAWRGGAAMCGEPIAPCGLPALNNGRPICERELTSEGLVHGPSLLVRHPV